MKADIEHTRELARRIEGSRNIVLLSHVNPDGDAIGTLLGLYHYLRRRGKDPLMAVPNRFPAFLDFLPESSAIRIYRESRDEVDRSLKEAQLIICLDLNDLNRLDRIRDSYTVSGAFKVLIDHHPEPQRFADLVISDRGVSSSAELVFHLLSGMNGPDILDQKIAECLFTGIMTDTGCFQFGSSDPRTFRSVARLLEQGIDKDAVFSGIYENYSLDRMRLMGYCLKEKMVVLEKTRTAYISLSLEELKRFNHQTGDTEGFVNLPFSIAGIMVSALIIEKNQHVRLSFRSKGRIDINRFARKFFNGGGHTNAAGGESGLGLKETIGLFERSIAEFLKVDQ